MFVRDVERDSLIHFPSLKQFGEGTDFELDINIIKNALMKMKKSFEGRFQEFRKEKATLSFVINPLDADTDSFNFSAFTGVNQAELEQELADLQGKRLKNFRIQRHGLRY